MGGFSGTVTFGGSDPWFSVDINAVAFSIGSLEIRWYGIFIATGLILALLYAMHYAKSFGVDSDRMIDAVFIGIICGVIGARAYYVVFNYDEFAGQPFTKLFMISEGGMAIYGGVIFGLVSGYFLCKWRKIKPLAMIDLASLGFLIGQILGRWGNFTNQEAFGSNTTLPWGMFSANTKAYLTSVQGELAAMGVTVDPNMPVHPCFLYESLWNLIGFLFLHFYVRKHRKYDGQIFLLYVFWYGLGRFWIEGLRTDSLMMGPYRVSQFLAGACVIVAGILLLVFRKRRSVFGEEGLAKQLAEEAAEKERRLAEKEEKKTAEAAESVTEATAEEETVEEPVPEEVTVEADAETEVLEPESTTEESGN